MVILYWPFVFALIQFLCVCTHDMACNLFSHFAGESVVLWKSSPNSWENCWDSWFFKLQLQWFFKAEVSKKMVIEEKRRVAEEKLSQAVPQRVEVMRHEGIWSEVRGERSLCTFPWSLLFFPNMIIYCRNYSYHCLWVVAFWDWVFCVYIGPESF